MAQVVEDFANWLYPIDDPSSRTDTMDSGCGAECHSEEQERWYLVQFQLCALGVSFVISITLISCSEMCVINGNFRPSPQPRQCPPPRRLPPLSRGCRSREHSCNLRALIGALHVVANAWKPTSVARGILFIKDARNRFCRVLAASTDCSQSVVMRYLNLAPTLTRHNSGNAELRRALFPTASFVTSFLSQPSKPASKGETEICFNETSFACCSFWDSAVDALHKHDWRGIGACTSDYLYGPKKANKQTSSDCGVKRRNADCLCSKSVGHLRKKNSQQVCQSDKKESQSTISNRTVDEMSKVRSAPPSEALVSNSPYTPLVRFIHIGETPGIMLTTHPLAGEKDLGGTTQCAPIFLTENLSTGIQQNATEDSLRRISSDPDVDDATSDLLCGDVCQIVNKYAYTKEPNGNMQATQLGTEPCDSGSTDDHRCLLKYQLEKERECSNRHQHIVNKKEDKYAPREAYDKKEGDTKYSDRLNKTVKQSISENTQTRRAHGLASDKLHAVTSTKASSILNAKLPERRMFGFKCNRCLALQTESMTCSVTLSRARNDKLVRAADHQGKGKMVLETAKHDQQHGRAKPFERKGLNSITRGGNSCANKRHMIEASEKSNPTGARCFHLAVDELDLQGEPRKQGCILTSNTRRSDVGDGLHRIPHRLSKTSKNLPQTPEIAAEHPKNKYSTYWKPKSRCGNGDRGHDNLKETVDDALKHLTKKKQQELMHLMKDCSSCVHNAVDFRKCSFERIEQCRSEWRGPFPRKSFVEKFRPYTVGRRSHRHASRNVAQEFNNMDWPETYFNRGDCVEVACVKNLKPSDDVDEYCSLSQTTETSGKGNEHFDPGTSCKTCDTVAFLDLFLHLPEFLPHEKHPAGQNVSNTKKFQKFLSTSPLALARKGGKDIQQGTSISNQEIGKDRKMITGKQIMRRVSGVLGSPREYNEKSNAAEGTGKQLKVDTSNIRDNLSHKGIQKKDLNSRGRQEFNGKTKVCKKSLHDLQTFYPSPGQWCDLERRCVKVAAEYCSVHTKSVHSRTSMASCVVSTLHQVTSPSQQQHSCQFHNNDMGNVGRAIYKLGDRAASRTGGSQLLAITACETREDESRWTHRSRIPLPVHFRHQGKSHKLDTTEEQRPGSAMDYLLPDNHWQRSSDDDGGRVSRGSPQSSSPLRKVGDAEAAAGMGKVKKKMKYQVFTTGLAKAEPQKVEEQKTKDGVSKGGPELHGVIVDSNLKMYDGKNQMQEHSNSKRTHREGEVWRTDCQKDTGILRCRRSSPTFPNRDSHGHPARNKQGPDRSRRGHTTSAYGPRRSSENCLGDYPLQTQASVCPPISNSQVSSPLRLPPKHKSLLSATQETVGLGEDDTRAKIDSDIQDRKETNAISEMESCVDAQWLHSASDEALLVSLDELDKRLEDIHTHISDTTSRAFVKEAEQLKMVTREPCNKMRSRVPRGVRSDLARSTLKSTSHSKAANVSKSADESRMRVEGSRMRAEESRMRIEDSRMRAEESRMRGEDSQMKAEESRMRVEDSRMRAEESRMRGEDSQMKAEESRMRVEDSRMRAEESRMRGEDSRMRAEESRMRVEDSRMRAEESRMRGEDSRMRAEESRMRALKAAEPRVSKTGADEMEIPQTLSVTEKQKSTGTSRRQPPTSFTKRSMSEHRAKLLGPGIRTFYHIYEDMAPTDRRLRSQRVETKSSEQSFRQNKDGPLSTPLAKMVMAALDRHSRCLSADMWKHTVELRQSMRHPCSLWKSKRHEEVDKKLLCSSSLASHPYKFAKLHSASENLGGVTTAQENQQLPEGALPKEVRQTSNINESGGEYKPAMSTANVRNTVEPTNAGEERLVNASDSQEVHASFSRQKTASKLPRLAGHSKTHTCKQLYKHERSETTEEIDAKDELNCENSTIKAKARNNDEELNCENSTVNIMRHADAPGSGFQRVANTKIPTSNREWLVSSHKPRKLGSDGLMAPVIQAKAVESRPDFQQSSTREKSSEKRHSTHRPLSRARIGEDKPKPMPETPTGSRSPVQPPASRTGNITVCPKSHRKDTLQSLSLSENPSCKKQRSICSNTSVNAAGSTSRTDQVKSLTDQFTEVECPDEKQCRRTKLVRTVPEDALVSFWTRKPCTAAYYRPRKRSTIGSKCSNKDGDAKEKRPDVQPVCLPTYSIRGMGQFVVAGNLSVIKCESREAHNPPGRSQGLYGEHQGSNHIQGSAENTEANDQEGQDDSVTDPKQRSTDLYDRSTTDTVHNVATVSRSNNIQEYVQSADTMVSTAAKSKVKESWRKQESKSDHSWKRQSCEHSCSTNRYLIESMRPGVLATISVPALAGKDGQTRKVSLADDKLPTPSFRLGGQASSREHIALGLWSVEPGRKQALTNRMEEVFQPCSHAPMREHGRCFNSREESEAAQKVPAEIISSEQYFANTFNTMVHDYPVRKTEGDTIERREVEDTTAKLQNEGNASSEDLDCPLPHQLPSDIRISWQKFMSAILADRARQSQVEQGTFDIRGQVMNVKQASNSHIDRQDLRAGHDASIQDCDSSSKEVMGDSELSTKNHKNDTDPSVKSWINYTDNSMINYINDANFSRKNHINETESSRKDHLTGTDEPKTGQTDLLNEQSASRHIAQETYCKGRLSQRHGHKQSKLRRLTIADSGGSITTKRRSATKIRAQRSVDQLIPVPRHPSEIFKCNHEDHHTHTFSTKVNNGNIKKIVSSHNESKTQAEDDRTAEASSNDKVKDYLKVFRKARRLEEVKSLQENKDTDNNSNKLWDRARSADVLVGGRKTFLPSRYKKRVGTRDYSEEGRVPQQHARLLYKLPVSGNQALPGQPRELQQRHLCDPQDLRSAEHEQSSLENATSSCDKEASTNKLVSGEIHQVAGGKGQFQAGQSGSDFGHRSAQRLCARMLRGKQYIAGDAVDYQKRKSGMKDSWQTQFVAENGRKHSWDRVRRDEELQLKSLDIQPGKRRGQPEDFFRKEAVSVNKEAIMFRNVCKEHKAATRKLIFQGGRHNCIKQEQSKFFTAQFSDGQPQRASNIPKSKDKVQPPSAHSVKSCQSKCFLPTADSSATSASTTRSSSTPHLGLKVRNAAEYQLKRNRGKRVCRVPVHNIQTKKHKHQSAGPLQATHSAVIAQAKVNVQTRKPAMNKQRTVLKAVCTENSASSCASLTHTHSGRPAKVNLQKKQPPHEILVSLSGCNLPLRNRLDELNLTHAEGGNLHVASSICPTQAEIRASQKPYTGFSYLVQDSSDVESRLLVEPSRCHHRSRQHTNIRIKPPKEDSFVGKIVKMFEKRFQFLPSDDCRKQTDDEQSGEW